MIVYFKTTKRKKSLYPDFNESLETTVLCCIVALTWFYATLIGCIPLSADDTYTYLGSTRLRLCFIDFTATSGGSTFAALLLCAVVGPSLIAVSLCYSQIFIAARLQVCSDVTTTCRRDRNLINSFTARPEKI